MAGFEFGKLRANGKSEELRTFHANPRGGFEPPIPLFAARKKFSFLGRAFIAGFGQARQVEFDRVATFVASGDKETTNNAG